MAGLIAALMLAGCGASKINRSAQAEHVLRQVWTISSATCHRKSNDAYDCTVTVSPNAIGRPGPARCGVYFRPRKKPEEVCFTSRPGGGSPWPRACEHAFEQQPKSRQADILRALNPRDHRMLASRKQVALLSRLESCFLRVK